jgi:hypothetical protein
MEMISYQNPPLTPPRRGFMGFSYSNFLPNRIFIYKLWVNIYQGQLMLLYTESNAPPWRGWGWVI